MARVFITGSSTGLGLMAGELLVEQGHEVVLHARDEARAGDTRKALPGAEVVVGDLASIAATKRVAERANKLGPFDAVIHNAGIGYREARRVATEDRLPQLFAVNTLAPYILTMLIERPKRLVYLSSGMHRGADANLDDLTWTRRSWQGAQAYAESKLHDVLLAFAVARHWPEVRSNALEPGWVATRMGGAGAPDDLDQAHRTQAWLSVSDESAALVTGQCFYHQRPRPVNPQAHDAALQDRLVEACERFSGVRLPRGA